MISQQDPQSNNSGPQTTYSSWSPNLALQPQFGKFAASVHSLR